MKMSLNDKLIKAFRQHGALSSAEATQIINQKDPHPISKRTVQRHIEQMMSEGVLKQNAIGGREQSYSFCREKPSSISDFFLNRFWNELFKVREVLHSPEGGANLAYLQLRSLVKILPKHMRTKLQDEVESKYSRMMYGERGKSTTEQELEEERIAVDLIEKVADALHKEIERELKNEDVKP
jgi:uncharacterized protein (DUF2249 family)